MEGSNEDVDLDLEGIQARSSLSLSDFLSTLASKSEKRFR